MTSPMEDHAKAVDRIAGEIRRFHTKGLPFRIYHGSTNCTRPIRISRDGMVDTSGLTNVVKVDRQAKTALVEPNVPMDQLVQETLCHGLVPPVVMEFPGITVGGGFAGTAGESSSFKYGFFDRTVNWIEIVLANGEKVVASPTEREDLFYGAAGSFGTLGVVTLVELRLLEAKSHVKLQYYPVKSVRDAVKTIEELMEDESVEYLDGILYALDRGVIISGRLADFDSSPGMKVQNFSRAHDPWFYLHAERFTTQPGTELTPLTDYLFRYDRGAFWTGRYGYKYFLTPFNRITRWLLDPLMHTRTMYHALHESGLSRSYIIQDLALPFSTVEEFIHHVARAFGIFPLWLCPLVTSTQKTIHPPSCSGGGRMLNVGLWGPGSFDMDEFVRMNRGLERKVRELGGMKWLYAHVYYTEQEFWEIYDRDWYEDLRKRYGATSLPTVYDKVKVDTTRHQRPATGIKSTWLYQRFRLVWPVSGLVGVMRAILGGKYLLAK